MQARSVRPARWPVVASIADWWRNWRERAAASAELARYDAGEVAHLAADVGISPAELKIFATHSPHDADLLAERLGVLHLDEAELARREKLALRDLQRVCTVCASKGRCRDDLRHDPDDPAWQDYCPNAATLIALQRAYTGARA